MPPKRKAAEPTAVASAAAPSIDDGATKRRSTARSSGGKAAKFSRASCTKWFNSFADKDEQDQIDPEGIEKLCKSLKLDPSSSPEMGIFERAKWDIAMGKIEVDSSAKLTTYLTNEATRLRHPSADPEFRDIASFAFNLCRSNPNARAIELETAMAMWTILYPDEHDLGSHRERFCEFLASTNKVKVINRDQWKSAPEFWKQVGNNFKSHDPETSAWPTLFDDYVEWAIKNPPPPAQ
ncbi:Cullin binding-domain-containing protein [Catenaria anguillulae PL171]|uniref:Defective in cullin neddylation protein n=1 Tax=Catenaria anguillulae PL171 TaxID=765915 RepID=A0A1Y2I1R7_9FUNG|nr:Cullin binding-domain-containing protein [Catenaria anguillulae PL171]